MGFLGNMNNNHFAMARFLRDRGVEAEVLRFDHEGAHFDPAADTYDLDFQLYCHVLPWGNPVAWGKTPAPLLRRDLERYDFLIGCGYAPAFCDRAGRELDVFVPYGGDLANFTRYSVASPNRLLPLWRAAAAQRRGIGRSGVIQMDLTNELYESLWERYRGGSSRWWFGMPMVHTGTYSPERVARMVDRTHWANEFAVLREGCDLLLFSHARHVWGGGASDPNQKGTDQLLRGLALFHRRRPEVRVKLATLEYGADVDRSRQLIAELGLEDLVQWFPMMYRKDLMVGILHADVVCAEFENSWLSSGVIYEALAMATPILGYREDRLYTDRYPTLYPMLNARSAESIAERLEASVDDLPALRCLGRQASEWYESQVVQTAVGAYLERIAAKTGGGGGTL